MGRGDYSGIVVVMLACFLSFRAFWSLGNVRDSSPTPKAARKSPGSSLPPGGSSPEFPSSAGAVDIIPGTLTASVKCPRERREGEAELGLVKQRRL